MMMVHSILAVTKFGRSPLLQVSIRECCVKKGAAFWQQASRARHAISHRRTRVTNYLRLSEPSLASINCLLQRSPLTDDERNQLPIGIDAADAEQTALGGDDRILPESIPPIANDIAHRANRAELPIFSRRQEILDLIEANQVIVLSGATGSGKTTQVPQYIMEDCAARQKPCRIYCTQPRRLATTSVANRVSVERGDRLGESVGYQIRLQRRLTPYTNLIFTTSGILLRMIVGERSGELLRGITHLIFDEVHEREDTTDFLLIAIKDALQEHPHLKVIVMSATLDADIFCRYFNDCPSIDVPGRMFPVEMVYLNELLQMTGYKTEQMERLVNNTRFRLDAVMDKESMMQPADSTADQNRLCQAYRIATDSDSIDHDLLFAVISHVHNAKPSDGGIIVFLPGFADITEQRRRIVQGMPSQEYELFLLHSNLKGTDRSDQERVFDKQPPGRRKIILSTNIAETSLTINDVAYVIDAGKVKQTEFDFRSQTARLETTWISKACAKQRAGRAGRTQSGFCYRLYTADDYEAMDEYTQPEILRVPLTEICLNSKVLSKDGSIEEFLLKAIQSPPVDSIRKSVELLKAIDALDDNERITSLGMHLAKLPVDAQIAKCILYGILLRCIDPIVTIASTLSVNQPFEKPMGRDGTQLKMIKKGLASATYSDHMVRLAAFNGWQEALLKNQEEEFAFENYLINDNMVAVNGVRALILNNLERLRLLNDEHDANENSHKWPVVKACLTAGLYPNICRIDRNAELFVCNDERMVPYKTSVIGGANGRISREFSLIDIDWVVFGTKRKSSYSNTLQIEDVTPVNAVNVALFGGPINLIEPISLQNQCNEYLFGLDEWVHLHATETDAQMVFNLRQKLNGILIRMLRTTTEFTTSSAEDDVISTVVDVLEHEEKHSDLGKLYG